MDEDLGLFGPGSVTWKLHGEPILLLAGLRSLYLQALHPRAMAGVAQNSSYQQDPWGRLARTSDYVATVIYGTTGQAQAAGRRLRQMHARMRARDPFTGTEFRIDSPELLRWVHVTEVESFLTTVTRAGKRLTPAEIDGYYAEQRRAAALVGLDPQTVPGSAAEIADYYAQIRPELRMTPDAARTAFFLTAPPAPGKLNAPLRWSLNLGPARWAYLGVASTAYALLPSWAQRLYGTLGLPTTALYGDLNARMLRLALRAIPHSLIAGDVYRSAMERAARHTAAGEKPAQEEPARAKPPQAKLTAETIAV
ncbi:oxygenase MpaB family protein [Micromonosporaceae bacterium DT194]|uniref:oxygenase MpaB family protein n=1 Tax=Melissospora conviva TaxID=3388432 RepID=UPI003C253DA2